MSTAFEGIQERVSEIRTADQFLLEAAMRLADSQGAEIERLNKLLDSQKKLNVGLAIRLRGASEALGAAAARNGLSEFERKIQVFLGELAS